MSDSICMSSYKVAKQATDNKRVLDDVAEHSFPDMISETPLVCTMGNGAIRIGVVIKGGE